jgi:hypothetical protein
MGEYVQVRIYPEYVYLVVGLARKTGPIPASPHFGKRGVITGNLKTRKSES